MKKLIVLTDDRTAVARDAAAYLAERGYEVTTVPRTVRLWDGDAVGSFAEACGDRLCGVIHPAPPFIPGGIGTATEADWDRASKEGALAAMCVTRAFAGVMRRNGFGSVVYLNSIHAEKPAGKGMLFSMGCAATQMLCREAAQYYGQDGLRFFFIRRGPEAEDPDMRSDVSPLYYGTDLRRADRKMPEKGDLNGLIAFLMTPEAGCLNGSDLCADGGMTLYYVHRRKTDGREYDDPQ